MVQLYPSLRTQTVSSVGRCYNYLTKKPAPCCFGWVGTQRCACMLGQPSKRYRFPCRSETVWFLSMAVVADLLCTVHGTFRLLGVSLGICGALPSGAVALGVQQSFYELFAIPKCLIRWSAMVSGTSRDVLGCPVCAAPTCLSRGPSLLHYLIERHGR